jgi:hypothetical protein
VEDADDPPTDTAPRERRLADEDERVEWVPSPPSVPSMNP